MTVDEKREVLKIALLAAEITAINSNQELSPQHKREEVTSRIGILDRIVGNEIINNVYMFTRADREVSVSECRLLSAFYPPAAL